MKLPITGMHGMHTARLVAVLGLLVLLSTACADDSPQNVLNPAGEYARAADRLWDLTFGIAAVIFFIVEAVLVLALLKFRHRPGRKAAQFHGNTRLEVVLTAVPALILAGIAVPTVRTILDLSHAPTDALEIKVVGRQFWWEFQYPEQGIKTANEFHIPTGRPVLLSLEGAAFEPVSGTDSEVIHSFWVPRLAGTQDIVPGHTNRLLLEADEPDRYLGQCKEYCGLSHANMRIVAVAQTPGDFARWVTEQSRPAAEDPAVSEGARLFAEGEFPGGLPCSGCHALDSSIDAQPAIGPNLAHFASRETFAGGMFENNEENLARWLADPPGVKPGAKMPDLGLTSEQIEALVAYLQSLE